VSPTQQEWGEVEKENGGLSFGVESLGGKRVLTEVTTALYSKIWWPKTSLLSHPLSHFYVYLST
jgi:hypothetical protein